MSWTVYLSTRISQIAKKCPETVVERERISISAPCSRISTCQNSWSTPHYWCLPCYLRWKWTRTCLGPGGPSLLHCLSGKALLVNKIFCLDLLLLNLIMIFNFSVWSNHRIYSLVEATPNPLERRRIHPVQSHVDQLSHSFAPTHVWAPSSWQLRVSPAHLGLSLCSLGLCQFDLGTYLHLECQTWPILPIRVILRCEYVAIYFHCSQIRQNHQLALGNYYCPTLDSFVHFTGLCSLYHHFCWYPLKNDFEWKWS